MIHKRLIDGIKNIIRPLIRKNAPPTTVSEPLPSVGVGEETQLQATLAVEAVHPEGALPPREVVTHTPKRIIRAAHSVSRNQISKSALKVLYQLNQAGYQAFLVGGCVRDLLLKRTPKDFDVATNARPEEVQALFRNCRLIGRRFLLAHVHFGRENSREIIEVATFRARHDSDNEGEGLVINGRIVRDNVYGTINEDAWRRDFTINALYYDISDFSLLDYANGMADIQAGIIRLIGDPILRYQEDPVRMLRAARFAAKLGFSIEPQTAAPIYQLRHLLDGIPKARLFEEILKLFMTGHGLQSFEQLRKFGLFAQLFPQVETGFSDKSALQMVRQALQSTDLRIERQQSVNPAFLLAALLWHPLLKLLPQFQNQGLNEQEALVQAAQKALNIQTKTIVIPRRLTTQMLEIWLLQPRLMKRSKNRRQRQSLLENPRFRSGYDFIFLRGQAGDTEAREVAHWWSQLTSHDAHSRDDALNALDEASSDDAEEHNAEAEEEFFIQPSAPVAREQQRTRRPRRGFRRHKNPQRIDKTPPIEE